MKIPAIWELTPCILVYFTDVSDERSAPNFGLFKRNIFLWMGQQEASPKRRKLCKNLDQKIHSPVANPLKFQYHNSHLTLQATHKRPIPCHMTWHYNLTACVALHFVAIVGTLHTDWSVGTFHRRLLLLSDDSFCNYPTTSTIYGPGSNPGRKKIFFPSRPTLGPTQPPVKWVPGLSRG